MAKATAELLEQLHHNVASELLARIQSGEASAQELNAAIKFLKDNGIEATLESNSDMAKLAHQVLPSFEDEDISGLTAN